MPNTQPTPTKKPSHQNRSPTIQTPTRKKPNNLHGEPNMPMNNKLCAWPECLEEVQPENTYCFKHKQTVNSYKRWKKSLPAEIEKLPALTRVYR